MPTPIAPNDVSEMEVAAKNSSQQQGNATNSTTESTNQVDCPIKSRRKRPKTSPCWANFDEVDYGNGIRKAKCKFCKEQLSISGAGWSTSHLLRHKCDAMKNAMKAPQHQSVIPFRPTSANPFLASGARYSNEKMREALATAVMMHELPFNIVDAQGMIWALQYGIPDFQKMSRKTVRNDCIAIYEAEKKQLKALLKGVSKISLTTDMWKSSHQVVEYMILTGHFIDAGWKLQKRVLSFVEVPAPRRGIDVADAIFKCLKAWGIENKVFSISVDNSSYNDSCLKKLKDNISCNSRLVLDGALFHVRCCAHILNLLVQDGLKEIKDVICNIRESVKYINHNDGRLQAFCELVEQKHLKERKLVIDCPTRWNSTFEMLSCALTFKSVFACYKDKEPHYDYAPSDDDWDKVDKVCRLLQVFNLATHVISDNDYPTANLYLAEVARVKVAIDNALEDEDYFMRQMAAPMKKKFDKYWGECNLLMAIASVLDPRCKLHLINVCFPMIYKPEEVAYDNVSKVRNSLQDLYNQYLSSMEETSSNQVSSCSGPNPSSLAPKFVVPTGFQHFMSIVREHEAIPPIKSELDAYLDDPVFIPNSEDGDSPFCALEWWRNNSMKYKVLSKMAADILAIPVSTVASESTFSAGGRVIDEYRSKLNEESIEALICGGDWLRNKYSVKRKEKEHGIEEDEKEILLKI